MKLSCFLAFFATVGPTLGSAQGAFGLLHRRQADGSNSDTRVSDICNIQLQNSGGDRKIAIVIDSSGSMAYNDPEDLRIQAGKALNGQLVSGSDQVTVVDFDGSAKVIYPLGDPAGAGGSFDQIDSSGSTFIADGILKAVAEIKKTEPTDGVSGIVVLTDGEDSDITNLISEINAATGLGIRVSFGFLAPPDSFSEPDLETAILKSGGTFMSFNEAENIQPWLFLLLSNGLTAKDNASGQDQPLLSGITISKLTGADAVTFSYKMTAGEQVDLVVTSLTSQELKAELGSGNGTVGTNSTAADGSGDATLSYTASSEETIKLAVSATGGNSSVEGVFQVSLNSSLGISGCTLPDTNTTTNSTTKPPKPTTPPVVAAGSKLANFGIYVVGIALATMIL